MNARSIVPTLALAALVLAGCGDDDSSAPEDAGADSGTTTQMDAGPPGCAPGTSMCGDTCVDTESSRTHCGECGNACEADEACVEGSCAIVCPASQSACDGVCADLDTDRRHCGECGTSCDAGELCVDGSCEVSCPAGQTLCGTTCVDTSSEPAHCGECGNACEAGEVCSEGACAATCGGGLMECDGACVATGTDPMNCGACGNVCAAPDGAAGACLAGTCRAVCAPTQGDCDADIGSETGDGCETPLATDVANCGACGNTCELANAAAGCADAACVIASCDAGFDDCDATASNGCEVNVANDTENCGACNNACASTETCAAGVCVAIAGENCSDPIALTPGVHDVTWTATVADYLTARPTCVPTSYTLEGPDVVFTYTAGATDELVSLRIAKPINVRWAAVVSTGACGTLTPEVGCISDSASAFMGGSAVLSAGQTAYVYLIDTSSGTAPLSRPLTIDFDATACNAVPPMRSLSPANGSATTRQATTFTAEFRAPVVPAGTITITGNMGTSLSYALPAPQVTFDTTTTVMTIDPGVAFPAGETLSISWSGLELITCGSTRVAAPTPTWQVTVGPLACAGALGESLSRMPTGLTTAITEYYVVADNNPNGYVYVGGTSFLWRWPKAGGPAENVEALAGLVDDNVGYSMVIEGQNIFVVDNNTRYPTQHLYRISSDGGATWRVEDYAAFPVTPGDEIRALNAWNGRIYLMTAEGIVGEPTEIWSVDANATTLPTPATLELEVDEGDCTAIARDASFYYLSCYDSDSIVRIPVGGGAKTTIATAPAISAPDSSAGALHGHDADGDGVFDSLYHLSDYEQIDYVCNPGSATPVADRFQRFGTATSGNYGLGFDRVGGVLWAYDDDTRELVSVQ
ncbi:hypothetical protein [Sandaracinus amylolyticus]|uniref:hypothetical protein n=1 Tax=Sandaracinus amylolyticus TaxID=927083 RepID=UPI001F322763|nr:hypothetical protein [Sandaracinus amylolyticus]UJR79192.1 Hypothetical protein I5071_12250 [Sandaracinus amylolyticus]